MPPTGKSLKFDLVSDLHVDRWSTALDWENLRGSDIVIVAGDVADTVEDTKKELEKLSKVYKTVLYIDGNHEFCEAMYRTGGKDNEDFDQRLREAIADLPNVHFLKDGAFIQDGVAIIGRNGHWDYKALDGVTIEQAQAAVMTKIGLPPEAAPLFAAQAKQDAEDLKALVKELNADASIQSILVVTHTLPLKELVPRKLTFPNGTGPAVQAPAHFSNLGNTEMAEVLKEDVNKKIGLWVFGHWHGIRDKTVDGVHFISHPRGTYRKDKPPYLPLTLEVLPPANDNAPAPKVENDKKVNEPPSL